MFIKIILCSFFLAHAFAKEQISTIPNVDYIFDSLAKQQWDTDEVLCRDKILNILMNVKNSTLWATWVWNSIEQSPTGIFFGARHHLGSYDQCLRPPWLSTHPDFRTQYCLAEIEMNEGGMKTMQQVTDPYARAEDYYLETKTIYGRSFSYISHGVCVPAGCPIKSVEKFAKALIDTGYLHAAKESPVSIHHCEVAGVLHEYSKGFYVYIYTIITLLFIAIASTYYVSKYPATASLTPYSFVNHLSKSFCLRRNWDAVMKEDKDALSCLHGIRFLTATIIVLIHSTTLLHGASVTNALDMESTLQNKTLSVFIVHCDLHVDTFFAISALLLGKTLTTLDITKPFNLLKHILKRYVRLIGPLAVTVFYISHVSMHTDDGPFYPKTAVFEQQACEKNWWLALLMLGNYFNVSEMCHPVTWYIPCDFHFYVITLVLLHLYRKQPSVGKAAAAIVLAIGFSGPAISTYVYDLPAVLSTNIGVVVDVRSNRTYRYRYIRTHNRMGPYVAGLVVGYFMSIYKPKDYKRIWSKTASLLGAYAFLNLMLVVFAAGMLCYLYQVYGILACVFTIFNRTTFAIGVLGVIVFCTYGDVPLINSFVSWSAFGPLSRLSYGVYLIHSLILYRRFMSLRGHVKHHMFDIMTDALGLVVISLMLSLAVWLLVEAPLVNITSRYLKIKIRTDEKVEAPTNGVHQNGINKQKIK